MEKQSLNLSKYLLNSQSLPEVVDSLKCVQCNELRIPVYRQEVSGRRICGPCLTLNGNYDAVIVQRDAAAELEVKKLTIHCPFRNSGCLDTGTVQSILDTHFHHCPYRPQVCPYCHKAVVSIQEHQQNDCQFCVRGMQTPDSQLHDEYGANQEDTYGGESMIQVQVTSMSTNEPNVCEFAKNGCKLHAAEDDLKTHYKQEVLNHFKLFIQKFEEDAMEIREIQKEANILLSHADFPASKVFNMAALQHLLDTIKKRLQETGCLPVEASSEHLLRIKSQHEQLIDSLNKSGNLLWIFNEVQSKVDLPGGSFFNSETFYTEPMGYRLRIRCYPKGNGRAMGQFFSLYFAIVHGEYDDLLEWPMRLNVTLEILPCNDNSGVLGSRSKRQTYCMGVDQEPFKKPLPNEVNTAVGNPRFLPLVELPNYLKNDKLYIQCRVTTP